MEWIKVQFDEIWSLMDLKRSVCAIRDSITDPFLYLNALTLIGGGSFPLVPAVMAARSRSDLQRVALVAKAAFGSGSLERDDRGGGG